MNIKSKLQRPLSDVSRLAGLTCESTSTGLKPVSWRLQFTRFKQKLVLLSSKFFIVKMSAN